MKRFCWRVWCRCIYVWLRYICRYNSFMAHLYASCGTLPWADKFTPCMRYHESMDMLSITFMDVSWRVVYTDSNVEILLHPHADVVIGLKIYNWKNLSSHIKR